MTTFFNTQRPSVWDGGRHRPKKKEEEPEPDEFPEPVEVVVPFFIAGCGLEPRTHEERLRKYREAQERTPAEDKDE